MSDQKLANTYNEAMDEIVLLKAENERLRKVLRKIANSEPEYAHDWGMQLNAHDWGMQLTHLAEEALVKPMPKGPAGDRGQIGWLGGEHDR